MRIVEVERAPAGERPIGELFKDLKDDATLLVRQEVKLAKVELQQSAKELARDAALIGAGAAFGVMAGLSLLAALCIGAIVLLDLGLETAVALWLGPLLVGVVLGIIAFGLLMAGRARMQRQDFTPHQTTESLKENTQWMRDRMTRDAHR